MDSLPISGGFQGMGYDQRQVPRGPYTQPQPPTVQPPMPPTQQPPGQPPTQQPPMQNLPRGATGTYQTPDGQTRYIMPGMAGRRGQFGAAHTLGGYDSTGRIQYFADQNSSQGAPGQTYGGRPTDPAAQQAYDRWKATRAATGGGFGGFGGNR